ncbi:MAG: phage holin family protein [Chitinophagaceae bacterium]|nr:phage holin family protein [Chitinophagaceae bacterium]
MENHTNTIKSLFQEAGDYLEVRLELLKLKAVDKSSGLVSSLGSVFIMMLMGFLFFFIFNIGLAFWLGDLLGKFHYGFFVVAGFYALVGLVFYIFRNKFLKAPLSNMVIKKLLN